MTNILCLKLRTNLLVLVQDDSPRIALNLYTEV